MEVGRIVGEKTGEGSIEHRWWASVILNWVLREGPTEKEIRWQAGRGTCKSRDTSVEAGMPVEQRRPAGWSWVSWEGREGGEAQETQGAAEASQYSRRHLVASPRNSAKVLWCSCGLSFGLKGGTGFRVGAAEGTFCSWVSSGSGRARAASLWRPPHLLLQQAQPTPHPCNIASGPCTLLWGFHCHLIGLPLPRYGWSWFHVITHLASLECLKITFL